ncbi:MAG TPA: DUF1640 domain-containing protein [Blastocatellia bacterium]|nr:DUF1640 domain-containing protein [Blastocatellia bacterium]
MPNSEAIETYNLLKERLGDETARALLRYIEASTQANVATKEDLYRLGEKLGGDISANKIEILNLREELKGDIAALRQELKGDIAALRQELKGDITDVNQELTSSIAALQLEMTRGLYKVRTILYLLIALILVTNPKIIELLTRVLGVFK